MNSSSTDSAAVLGGAKSFLEKHSDLYKELKRDDEEASVDGCFPPESTMPRGRTLLLVDVLARLHEEQELLDPIAVFAVRERPLYHSLAHYMDEVSPADLRTIADYLLLPKSLIRALDQSLAVLAARRDYEAACAGYNSDEATVARPRFVQFLRGHECLLALMEQASTTVDDLRKRVRVLSRVTFQDLVTKTTRDAPGEPPLLALLQNAFLDGLTGESLSEHGYKPSARRVLAYASGCVIADRPVPFAELPSQDVALALTKNKAIPLHCLFDPLRTAAWRGKLAVMKEFHSHGWSVAGFLPDSSWEALPAGAAVGSPSDQYQEILAWAHSLDSRAFLARGAEIFMGALAAGRFDAAKWLLETFDLRSAVAAAIGRVPSKVSATTFAAKHNSFEALHWLHLELGLPLCEEVTWYAGTHNNMEMLEWALERGCAWHGFAVRAALAGRHTDIALFAMQAGWCNRFSPGTAMAMACVVSRGDVDYLAAFKDCTDRSYPGWEFLSFLSPEAAAAGYEHVLEWVVAQPLCAGLFNDLNDYPLDRALAAAVVHNRPNVIRWLLQRARASLESGEPAGLTFADVRAARSKKLGVDVAYQLRHDDLLCWQGVSRPTAETLELLEPHFDLSWLLSGAVYRLDINFARIVNAKDPAGCALRAKSDVDVPKLLAHGDAAVPMLEFLVGACSLDLAEKDRDRQGLKQPTISELAAAAGSVALLRMALESGCAMSDAVLTTAARHGHMHVCRWLHRAVASIAVTDAAIAAAFDGGFDEVAAWLKERKASTT